MREVKRPPGRSLNANHLLARQNKCARRNLCDQFASAGFSKIFLLEMERRTPECNFPESHTKPSASMIPSHRCTSTQTRFHFPSGNNKNFIHLDMMSKFILMFPPELSMMNCPPGTVTGSDRAKQSPLSNSQTQVR
jgi:hypothetical protein